LRYAKAFNEEIADTAVLKLLLMGNALACDFGDDFVL
jgi:hypothetical protein